MRNVPPSQLPPAPRVVRRKLGSGCALMFGRFFILPHVLIGLITLLAIPTRCYVYNHGTHVQPTIHKLEHRTSRKSGDYYVIGFHYELGGRRYSEEYESLSASEGRRTHIGDKLDGRAAALLGHALFLRSTLDIRSDLLALGEWALLWNGLVWTGVYMIWIVPIRWRLLAKNGSVAAGIITGRQQTRGRGTRYMLFYMFQTADGQSVSSKSDVPPEGFRAAYEGAPVTVIYDPRKPPRSLPYEFSDFIVDRADIGYSSRSVSPGVMSGTIRWD